MNAPESGAAGEPMSPAQEDLLDRFGEGRRAALARVISIVENQEPGFQAVLDALHTQIRGSRRIGITGPPGAGKSTLTAELIRRFRARDQTVGVIAVDPTSPYTGGALLGDRIRMNEVAQGEGVFVRSMATRGALGGLAAATREAMDVLAAFGFDVILVETVGVGQSELDIAAAADTTVVVLVPESGDAIQTMKAGLMEAADLFVVNKADRPGAPRLAKEVEMMLHLRLGDAMKNMPAHHGVQLNRARTAKAKMEARQAEGGRAGSTTTGPGSGPGGSSARDRETAGSRPSSKSPTDTEPWAIPVMLTTAETGDGVPELLDRLDAHWSWLEASGELARRRLARLTERVRDAVQQRLLTLVWRESDGPAVLDAALDDLAAGRVSPYEVAARVVDAAIP